MNTILIYEHIIQYVHNRRTACKDKQKQSLRNFQRSSSLDDHHYNHQRGHRHHSNGECVCECTFVVALHRIGFKSQRINDLLVCKRVHIASSHSIAHASSMLFASREGRLWFGFVEKRHAMRLDGTNIHNNTCMQELCSAASDLIVWLFGYFSNKFSVGYMYVYCIMYMRVCVRVHVCM